jgi:hypothetical protein
MKSYQIFTLIQVSLLSLLGGCGPSLDDARKLGFNSVAEMSDLTVRGYATKADYADAAYRDPAFCAYGAYRINWPKDGSKTDSGAYVIDDQLRREWVRSQCHGKRVIWLVRKGTRDKSHDSSSVYGVGLLEYSVTEGFSPYAKISEDGCTVASFAEQFDRIWSVFRSDTLFVCDVVDEETDNFFYIERNIEDLEGNNISFSGAGSSKFNDFFDADTGFYLVEGTISKASYTDNEFTVQFQVMNGAAIKPVEEAEAVDTLRKLQALASLKTNEALQTGYPSVEFMLHAEQLGLKSYQAFLVAHQKALNSSFISVWEQRDAAKVGYKDGSSYRRHLQQAEESKRSAERRETLKKGCRRVREARQSCSTAGNFNNCMRIQAPESFVLTPALCYEFNQSE